MALVLKDRVKETTTSTGSGTIDLAGAATGFEGFVSAVGSGNACYYTILDANGSAWEVGVGTVTDAATDTLSRDTILESSNSDNAISLTSGTHTVFLTYPADKSVYRNTNDQIVATASGIVFSDSTVQTTSALTYTAGTGLSLSGTEFNVSGVNTSLLQGTVANNQLANSSVTITAGTGLSNGGSVALGGSVSIDVNHGSIDHDSLNNFVANEHVDHTSVTLTAGSGLSGGGDISSNRTFHVSGVDTSLLQGTIGSAQIANDAIDSQHYTDGSIDTAHIGNDQVTYAKIQNVSATDRILGRDSAGAGEIEEITASGLRTMINVADGATANVGDITSVVAGTGLSGGGTSGDVTVNVSGVDTSLLQGTISEAQIADNAVTLAKLAGGTDGQIITFDANGDPVAVGPGTDGQVLTSTGAGSPPAFEDASGGGSDTLQTVTGRGAVTTNDITVSGELVVSRPEAFAALKVASSGQQISFGNRGEDGNDGMVTIKLDDDGATYAASSGVQVSLNSAKSALAVVPTVADATRPRTVFNGGDSSTRPDGDGVVNIKSIHEDVPNLIVYGKSGGTSHLTEWKDSDGDTVAYIGEKGTLSLGKDFHIQKFDSYIATGVGPTDVSGVALTFDNALTSSGPHESYSYRIRCHDEESNRLDGSVFLARRNNGNTGWDVTTVAIQKNAQNEYPIVFNDDGSVTEETGVLKVKTGGASGPRDITVYIEGIYVNKNDVTGYIWGADYIWSKVSTAGGSLHSIYASGNVGVGTETPVSAINLVGGSYVNEAVPASDTPTTEDATVTLDLSDGNYHNIVLGANVTKFEFTNAKRGQKFILRITQHASSAKTVSWSNVDSDTGGTAATVRWAGNITPTMSTSTSHTDVYGFLCTNNAGSNFDGFIIGQDLPD